MKRKDGFRLVFLSISSLVFSLSFYLEKKKTKKIYLLSRESLAEIISRPIAEAFHAKNEPDGST